MASLIGISVGGLCLLLFPRLVSYSRSRRRGRPPPGPPGLPLIGNVRDIPAPHEHPWLKYHEWCLEYNSDVIRLNALGSNIIVIDSLKAANELLDRRSAIYSDRPRMLMLSELAGFEWNFGIIDYGEEWRVCRKMTHHEFHATAFEKYRPILERNAHELVRRLMKEPVARLPDHLKHMTGANILEVADDIKALPEQDPFIKLTEAGQEAFGKCAISFFFVDVFPSLKYVPAWLPGAGFKRRAAVWREAAARQLEVAFADYLCREELGKADNCMAKALAEAYGTDEAARRHAKMTTTGMYLGGSETIAAVMHTFFLTMLLYPEVQARARREFDAALGAHRIPTFQDLGSVPYIDALIRELLRWQPITRLNIPHKLREDDVYDGYHLEKDSIVIVNNWSILHDKNTYPDPYIFSPTRFLKASDSDGALRLDPDAPDPRTVVFGFRCHVCPGQTMVLDTLWITIAAVLACAEISACPAEDGEGEDEDGSGGLVRVKAGGQPEMVSALVTEPRRFACSVRFRSEAHAALLES